MTCARSRRLLLLYHDGQLDQRRAGALRDHLAGCPACSAHLAALRRTDAQIARALTVAPSHAFRDTVLRAAGYPGSRSMETPAAGPFPYGQPQAIVRTRAGAGAVPVSVPPPARSGHRILLGSLTGALVAALLLLALSLAGNPVWRHPSTHLLASTTGHRVATVPARPHRTELAVRGLPTTAESLDHATVPATPRAVRRPTVIAATAIRPTRPPSDHGLPAIVESPARATVPATPKAVRRSTEVPATIIRPTLPPTDHAAGIHIVSETLLTKGDAHAPLWSHDSASLLYLQNWALDAQSGWYTGVLLRHGPSGTIRLAAGVRNYAWSPDDREIAYTTQAPPGSPFAQELHLVGADGRGDHAICGVDRAPIQYVGSRLVAVQHGGLIGIDPHAQPPRFAALPALPSIAVADEDNAFYALSPDGRYLAYQDRTGLRLWDRSRLIAGLPTLILREPLAPYREASFHFSWDSRLLVYSDYDGRYTMLYRRALPSGAPVALNDGRPLHGPIDLVGPLSSHGAVAAIRTGAAAQARNYLIDTLHGAAHALFPPAGVGPVGWWSPDGRHLVYTVYRGDDAAYTAIARVTGPDID